MTGRFPYISVPAGRALSLLSSRGNSWISSTDLSSRCSAALRELIAENRATILANHLILDRDWHLHHAMEELGDAQRCSNSLVSQQHHQILSQQQHYQGADTHVTLDLMQAPSAQFGFLSVTDKDKEEEEEEETSELWNSFEGAHVV